MARQFATRLALIAFATVAVRGLLSGADFELTLQTALMVTAAFYGLGIACGDLARRVVEENAESQFAQMKAAESKPTT